MLFGFGGKIWFYREPVDFRNQQNGLIMLVADQLNQNPTSGDLYIFRNRQANKIKLLCWDVNGFWLHYKILERGRFVFPCHGDEIWSLSKDQLSWILSGLDITKQKQLPVVTATNFF